MAVPEDKQQPSYYLPRHEFEFYKEATEVALRLKAANGDATVAKAVSFISLLIALGILTLEVIRR